MKALKTQTLETQPCPCGSRRKYARCCGQYLEGAKVAPTAEALMRSRYTAFYIGNTEYLVATHHPEHRADNEQETLQQSMHNTRWTNLIVLKTQKGQKKDKTGTVEFVAAYQNTAATLAATKLETDSPSRQIAQLHEKSQFIREHGQWFYTQGDQLPPYQPKREQPCWCGSGKQFRQCHEKH